MLYRGFRIIYHSTGGTETALITECSYINQVSKGQIVYFLSWLLQFFQLYFFNDTWFIHLIFLGTGWDWTVGGRSLDAPLHSFRIHMNIKIRTFNVRSHQNRQFWLHFKILQLCNSLRPLRARHNLLERRTAHILCTDKIIILRPKLRSIPTNPIKSIHSKLPIKREKLDYTDLSPSMVLLNFLALLDRLLSILVLRHPDKQS